MKHRVVTRGLAVTILVLLVGWGRPVTVSTRTAGAGFEPVERACTSFCLDNSGQAVFGSNYDNEIWEGLLFVNKRGVTKTGWEAGTTGLYARWTAEYGSVTFNLAGMQMVWAGMNEAGLAISTMWLGEARDPTPDERPPLISPLWIQYQLDTCATVAEVMANDARVRVADVLEMDVGEAFEFFAGHAKIAPMLQTLLEVGLGYVKLGQSAPTLSGGEAQRIKLARELSRNGGGHTLYILDEPTTGLHFADIQKLLEILHRLVDSGHTVMVIEHNLDVVKTADWVIDLGPEGGEDGGYIVAEGTPAEIAAVEASYTGQFLNLGDRR